MIVFQSMCALVECALREKGEQNDLNLREVTEVSDGCFELKLRINKLQRQRKLS